MVLREKKQFVVRHTTNHEKIFDLRRTLLLRTRSENFEGDVEIRQRLDGSIPSRGCGCCQRKNWYLTPPLLFNGLYVRLKRKILKVTVRDKVLNPKWRPAFWVAVQLLMDCRGLSNLTGISCVA